MLKAFWTWDPVSSGTYRAFDEPHAYANNKWFFDKSVWQKMFRTMSGCGFDAFVLANTHPFPFMVDSAILRQAGVMDEATLFSYQAMHHWIFETAFDYDLMPYLAFFNIYYPDALIQARGIAADTISTPNDFAVEYTKSCLRSVLETYPEISGFVADAGGVDGGTAGRIQFIQQAILDTMDAARPDATIYLRGMGDDPAQIVDGLTRRGGRPIHYIAPYTYRHLVHASADPQFTQWVDSAGPEFVMAEFDSLNFEPWTSFSYDTVEEILADLQDTDCQGLLLHPLAEFEWPHTSDTLFKYQWQRDLPWYNAWGGASVQQMMRQGQPKWLSRNPRLIPGFSAGSRILELLSLYVAGDKEAGWRPQFCEVSDTPDAAPHLFSIADMLSIDTNPAFSGRDWWEQITGDTVVHLEEYISSGVPDDAYGPDEFIEELADLSEQAVAAGEKGLRSASGEKELPSFARDAVCMGRLGEFYVERFKAALSHARGEDNEALNHMIKALDIYRDIKSTDSFHRDSFRIRTDHSATLWDWDKTIKALEAEHTDASQGKFEPGPTYPL